MAATRWIILGAKFGIEFTGASNTETQHRQDARGPTRRVPLTARRIVRHKNVEKRP